MNRLIHWVSASDTRFLFVINQQWKCRLLDFILPKITHLGGATFTLSFLFLLLIFNPYQTRLWSIDALLSLTLSHLVVHLIKKKYCRKRPYLKLPNINIWSNPLKDYSFPSGHTTAAFSIAIVFILSAPTLIFILLPLATIIGLSRIYLGLHYPTDVFIGALLGTISSLLAVYVFPF